MYCEPVIKKISCYPTLNAAAGWTHRFIIRLSDGSEGTASSPEGETLSCHEQPTLGLGRVSQILNRQDFRQQIEAVHTQTDFDQVLAQWREQLGHNSTYALSLAYFYATCHSLILKPDDVLKNLFQNSPGFCPQPILLGNVLNGGWHAYTNPVLSDFSEYLLVPKFQGLRKQVDYFVEINRYLKDALNQFSRIKVGENWVYAQDVRDNKVWIDFILSSLEKLDMLSEFDLMIDASAGDLYSQHYYELAITHQKMDSDKFVDYWTSLLKSYPIQILEDPFSETDKPAWIELCRRFPNRLIAGDNLCASDHTKIAMAAQEKMLSAIVVKPNQAGTVSDLINAIEIAVHHRLVFIPSHRSLETASTFLSDLSYSTQAAYIKLGLFSEFSTILKFNKLLELYANPLVQPG